MRSARVPSPRLASSAPTVSLFFSPLAASAYSPPELAQRLFIKTDPSPPPLLAHPSFDAWGFGVVLYEALAGEILFRRHVSNDNIQDPAEQSQLCMWRSINAKLLAKIAGDEPVYEAARNLVARPRKPARRRQSWRAA